MIKVAQWGSGNVGRQSMRTVAARPDMELVGLMVTSPDKVGTDVGELAGLDPLGIAATDDINELAALDADVVLHMPLPSLVYGDDPGADLANFVRLLEAGKHVVTTVGYMYPQVYGERVMGPLTAACAKGGATFHGTGANPGWFGDLLPLLMTGLSMRVDQVNVREISCFVAYPSPEIMFDMMNFAKTPEAFEANSARHRGWLDGLFTEAVHMVAHGLGVQTDDTTSELETRVAVTDLETASGVVPAGTIAGQRYHWAAVIDGEEIVRQETVWRMHDAVAPDWPVGDWSIAISGRPNMHLSLDHGWNPNVLGSTAAHAINAVPYLIECDPGVQTFLDLPLVAGRGAHYPSGRR
ncbi:MAG: NAD(P)H-dependent amine dehydrogenase family protein [Acidimicrobiales bacterium]